MKVVRYILTAAALFIGCLLLYAALTVPMVAAGGPAILAVAVLAVAYFLFPKRGKTAA